MKNESGKYYFSMDKSCYTNFPNEKEVLLLQGLVAEVKNVSDKSDDGKQWKEIILEISEEMQRRD